MGTEGRGQSVGWLSLILEVGSAAERGGKGVETILHLSVALADDMNRVVLFSGVINAVRGMSIHLPLACYFLSTSPCVPFRSALS